jgi:hypothetical protein
MSKPISWLSAIIIRLNKIATVVAITIFALQAFGAPAIAQSLENSQVPSDPITTLDSGNDWIELQNTSSEVLNINGRNVELNGNSYTLTESNLAISSDFELNPDERFLICLSNNLITSACDYYLQIINEDPTSEDPANTELVFPAQLVNEESSSPAIVPLDTDTTAPPVPTHVSPADGISISSDNLTLIDWKDVEDVSGVSYRFESSVSSSTNPDGSFSIPYPNSQVTTAISELNTTAEPEGVFYWHVKAVDGANNSGWSQAWMITVDNTAPVVSVNSLATNDRTPTLTGNTDDPNADIFVTINGSSFQAVNNGTTWSLDYPIVQSDGTYDVFVSATDLAGNIGNDITSNELYIDGTAPTITVEGITSFDHSPTLRGTIDDKNASIEIEVRGQKYVATNHGDGTWSLSGIRFTANGVHGTYDVKATATDGLGNIGFDSTTNELTITGFIQGAANLGATFYGSITQGLDGSSENDADNKQTNEKENEKTEKVASKDDNDNFDWRWLILTGAIIAFLWFLLKTREEETT